MKHWPILFILCTFMVPAGCEDRAVPPGDYDADPPVEAEPEQPTAEQLLRGPREPLRLSVLPLTLDVPESWEITTLRAGITFLEGPAPSGDVQIQLATRPFVTREQLELRYTGAQAEAEENPNIRRIEMRQVNDLTLLERLEVEPLPPGMTPATDVAEDAEAVPGPIGTPLRWTIGVYVRMGEQFEVYELNFIALTLERYEQDEQFLREIIETIRHDPDAPAPRMRP